MESDTTYTGRSLPPIDVGRDKFDELFSIATECVVGVTGTPRATLLGQCRKQPYCTHRFMLYKLARHEIGVSEAGSRPTLTWIGIKMGKDHGAVLHGIRALEGILSIDRSVADTYLKVLVRYEIERAKLLCDSIGDASTAEVLMLKDAANTIHKAIADNEVRFAEVMEELAKIELKGGSDESLVQDECPPNG